MLLILTFLAYLPYSKHLHIVTAAVNVFFGHTRPGGRIEPLRFDVPEEEMRFGAGTVPELTWKQTMDSFSCTECGRCQDVCPAFNTGKELSPKLLIMALRDQVFAEGPKLLRGEEGFEPEPLVPGAVTDDVVWDCVTCGACVRECPVSIEHVDHIIDLRRHLVMVDSRFPAEAEPMLRDVERASNPWGKPQTERADWAERLGVRVLETGRPPARRALLGRVRRILRRARAHRRRVDGQVARGSRHRLRDPGSARVLHRRPGPANGQRIPLPVPRGAERQDAQRCRRHQGGGELSRTASTRSATSTRTSAATTRWSTTPSCWPSWYAREGCNRTAAEGQITYHDSCYLARHNDVINDPRELVAAVGEPIEMERSGKRTFCCGAGGAHMWMEERAGKINDERVREAAETGAETLAVACPFCTVMLDDGVRQRGDELRVVDVSTLLAEAVR